MLLGVMRGALGGVLMWGVVLGSKGSVVFEELWIGVLGMGWGVQRWAERVVRIVRPVGVLVRRLTRGRLGFGVVGVGCSGWGG
ncbi:hypothetical protein GCM10010530_13930 [Kribbella aluminosa]